MCHKTIEKLGKCRTTNDIGNIVLGQSQLFPPNQFRSGQLPVDEQPQISQSSESEERPINAEPDNLVSESIPSSTSRVDPIKEAAPSTSVLPDNVIANDDGKIVEDEVCSTTPNEKRKIGDNYKKYPEGKEISDVEKSLMSIKNSRAGDARECNTTTLGSVGLHHPVRALLRRRAARVVQCYRTNSMFSDELCR